MATLYQFKDYLEQKDYEIPRLLLNYINGCYDSHHQEFQEELIEHFYFYSMYAPGSRSMKASFTYHLLDEIQPFFRQHYLDITRLKTLLNAQMIPIENKEDLLKTLKTYYEKDHCSVRTLSCLENTTALVLQLRSNGALRVYRHNDLFYLQNGHLKPFPPLSHLYYNAQFELEPLKPQMLDDFCGHFYRFYADELEIKKFSKNFSLLETKRVNRIQDYSPLFLSLKKLESYFIKAKTDPFYQELVQFLQTGYQLLIENHPKARKTAEKCMDQAQTALRNMYPRDRLLLLLTANIEYRLKGLQKKHKPTVHL